MSGDGEDRNNLVTVVVPCYNDGEFLLENLESLQAQTYRNFEVIVVNDGSTDPKTLEVLENLEQDFPSLDLRVYSQSNQGLPGARNSGVREAQGKWVMMLDADDLLAPTYLEKTLSLGIKGKLDFVTTDYEHFGMYSFITRPNINFYEQLFSNHIHACSLFKKKVLEAEPYDLEFIDGFEDWELYIRLYENGYKGGVLHEPLYYYRRKPVSMLSETYYKRSQLISKIRQKHAGLYKSDTVTRIRKEWSHGRVRAMWPHRLRYYVGLRFPRLAHWVTRLYQLKYHK
jgi:glycosyltransferase involved in cell wall biosynthesis